MSFSKPFKLNETDAPLGAESVSGYSLRSHIAAMLQSIGQGEVVAHRYLLLLRFALANIVALSLLGAAAMQGWIDTMLAADGSIFSIAIAVVFAFGLIWSVKRAVQISHDLNQVKLLERYPYAPVPDYLRRIAGRDGSSRSILAGTHKLRLIARIAPIRHIANSLVLLGLTGTVIGFIVALSGVRPDAVADVSQIGPMVSTLIRGMSIALYTTLVGSLLHIWLMVNVRMLEGGTIHLLTATVELGERHADA